MLNTEDGSGCLAKNWIIINKKAHKTIAHHFPGPGGTSVFPSIFLFTPTAASFSGYLDAASFLPNFIWTPDTGTLLPNSSHIPKYCPYEEQKAFQPRQTSLTSCPGYCQLKLTSTSGSPRTVQATWIPSLTLALLGDATIVAEGGPLGTDRRTALGNRKSVTFWYEIIDKT